MKCPFSLPCGWILRPVWQEFDVTLGKMIQSEPTEDAPIGYPYHKAASVQDGVLLDPFEKMFASEIGAAKLGVRKGDLLVCEGGDIGRSAIVSDEPDQLTIIQNSVHRVRSKGRYPVEYLKLVLDAYRHNGWLDVFIGKNTIAHFTAETFNNLLIPLPNPQYANKAVEIYQFEAKAIEDLLSYMESKLNKLSEYRQSLITQAVTRGLDPNVEMKDSGVPWVGMIPYHWKCGKIKYFASISAGGTPDRTVKDYWNNGTIPWIKTGELLNDDIVSVEECITPLALRKSAAKLFPEGTVLVAMYGQGKTRGMAGMLTWPATTNQACACICPKNSLLLGKFLLRLMESSYAFNREKAAGTGQPNLNQDIIANLLIPIPPLDEQMKIINHLDVSLKHIQHMKGTIDGAINKLQEYRSSLITAVVTGKIDINEVNR